MPKTSRSRIATSCARNWRRAGFRNREIDRALDWLDGLNAAAIPDQEQTNTAPTFRIYDDLEQDRFDAQCRGYLLYLEQSGILNALQREIVIDRLLALDSDEVDIEQIKWVVMMVLFSQPGQEQALRTDGGPCVR